MPTQPAVELSTEIAAPVDQVFAFHLDTRNAGLIAPRGTSVAVTGTFPVVAGAIVTMSIRRRPLPATMRWRVRIEEVERPLRIVDVAERSPFAAWRHEHLFAPSASGTTLTDRITYRLPGGALGRLLDRLLVRRLLMADLAARHRRTREVLEPGAEGAPSRG